ncbi:MAG: SusC/RagA family TonB-linked outer membrane protein, partial [Bacteroidales bacterium]|nr:SusC/RagA family TonB-linked outer membrane protein [Bacteroidales bacterium]
TKFDNPDKLLSDHFVGKVLGDIWGYHVEGLFATDEEAAAYEASINDKNVNAAVYSSKAPYNHLMAGDVKFADVDKSGTIDNGKNTLDDHGDLSIIGNNRPRYLYSLKGDFSWKGLDVSMFFQGIGKINWNPTYRADYFWSLYSYQRPSYIPKDFEALCWSSEEGADNSNAYFPRRRSRSASVANGALRVNTDRYLQNAAYIRLKNLTIGYTIPIKKKYVQKARAYVSGENLWYWSPLLKHTTSVDPEVATANGGTYSDTVYPYSKIFSVGVDITF